VAVAACSFLSIPADYDVDVILRLSYIFDRTHRTVNAIVATRFRFNAGAVLFISTVLARHRRSLFAGVVTALAGAVAIETALATFLGAHLALPTGHAILRVVLGGAAALAISVSVAATH
jgi:hypothetical protein